MTKPITFRFLITALLVTQWLCGATVRAAVGVRIGNDTVWKDDRGEEIMCQGGNLAKFGETFYFYGWGDYPGDNRRGTTSYTTAGKLEGPWAPFKKVECEPESKDCFNAQTDFLFEVRGTAGSFVLWGGDRWSQRTKLGIGRNVWLPLPWKGGEPILKWHPSWNVDAAAGTWTANRQEAGEQP